MQKNVQQHPVQKTEITGQMAGGIGRQEHTAERSESQEGGETSTTSCEMTWHKRAGWRGTGGHETSITGEADGGYVKVKNKTKTKAESLI